MQMNETNTNASAATTAQSIEDQLAAEAAAKSEKEALTAARTAKGKEIAAQLGETVSDVRAVSVAIAQDLGADLATLRAIISASRVSRKDTITLPRGRYGTCSRGRDWCRSSDGEFYDDHEVGPGKYTVGSSDGFSRKEKTPWTVEHITVGEKTWTIGI